MKNFLLLIFIISLLVVASLFNILYPGITHHQTAEILLKDVKGGERALGKAVWHGKSIYDDFSELTNEYNNIHYIQAERLIKVLEVDDSPECIKLASMLLTKNNLYARLIGVNLLAQHGKYHEKLSPNSFVINTITQQKHILINDPLQDWGYLELAARALGYLDVTAVPYLNKLLETNDLPPSVIEQASKSLKRLGITD